MKEQQVPPICSNLKLAQKAQEHCRGLNDEQINKWMRSLVYSIRKEIEDPSQTMSEQVQEFHDKQCISTSDLYYDPEKVVARIRVMSEEFAEVIAELTAGTKENLAHELADLIYTVVGTALVFGIEIEPVFAEVHRANMTKGVGFCKKNYVAPEIKV